MDYLSTIWEFLNGSFVSATINAGASALLSELINRWNKRKNKEKKDLEDFLNENYDNGQIEEIAEEIINNNYFQVSQNNSGGINIVSTGTVIVSNTLDGISDSTKIKKIESINEKDIEQEIASRFSLFEMEMKTRPFPEKMTELIKDEIESSYSPGKVFIAILNNYILYLIYPIINERLRIEKEVREKYKSILPKERFDQIKNDICSIADKYYFKSVDYSTIDTIHHILKRYPQRGGCEYKIKEYEEGAERMKNNKPTRLYDYITSKMTLIEIELKYCKANKD